MSATAIDQAIAGLLLAALAVLSIGLLPEWLRVWRTAPRWAAIGVVVAAAVALGLRLFYVQPALVHGDFQGSLVLEGILGFPLPSGSRDGTYGADYGQGSFVLLGMMASLFGRRAEVALAANVVVSVLTTFPLAFVAARWAGRPSAGLCAAAAWATSPLVARLAHSEDSHIAGLFFACVALAYAELAWSSRTALVATVVAVLLTFWTRQTYYPVGTLALCVILERQRREGRKLDGRWLGAAALVVMAALAFRFTRTLGTSNVYSWIALELVRRPMLALGLVVDHPFFAVTRLSPLVATVGLFGFGVLALRSPVRLAVTAHALLWFVLTLPSGLPPEGISWSFRLPIYALALIAVGAGAACLDRRDRRPILLACAVAAVGLAGTATLNNHAPDAQFVEYRYLSDMVAQLPRPLTLIHGHDESRFPCLSIAARFHVGHADITQLPEQPEGGTWVVLEGLGAHAYTMAELSELHERGAAGMMPDAIRQFFLSLFDRRTAYGMASIARPHGMRPEFRALVARSTQIGSDGPWVQVDDIVPAAVFDERRFPLRMYRWAQK